jgi:hypothetical protein
VVMRRVPCRGVIDERSATMRPARRRAFFIRTSPDLEFHSCWGQSALLGSPWDDLTLMVIRIVLPYK